MNQFSRLIEKIKSIFTSSKDNSDEDHRVEFMNLSTTRFTSHLVQRSKTDWSDLFAYEKVVFLSGVIVAALLFFATWQAVLLPPLESTHKRSDIYTSDPNIIFSAQSSDFKASLFHKSVSSSVSTKFVTPDSDKALYVTGTYTSNNKMPTGLFIKNGEVINSNLLKWDGIFVLSNEGDASLHHRKSVKLDDREFDLSKEKDVLDFLKFAADESLSVLQSHLIVSDGVNDVTKREGAKTFKRRILIQTADDQWLVYDSSPEKLTFWEAAQIAHSKYGAKFALNFDMGAYDYCLQEVVGLKPVNCGLLADTKILTNIVKFFKKP